MFLKKSLSICVLSAMIAITGCQTVNNSTSHQSESQSQTKIQLNTSQMMEHLKAFEKIANENGGNRAVATKGGLASAQYIIEQAKSINLKPQVIAFENRNKKVGQNIIVEIPGQSKESAIIVGAHYDSVEMGPGINDNASGVALVLELMKQYSASKVKPQHTIYFAFWDSEEDGIGGSQDYVKRLTADQLKGIKAYINVDMVGTKSPEILIADGDKSSVDDMEKMLKERGMSEADYKPLIDGLRSIPSHAGDLALENTLKDFFKLKNTEIREDTSTLTASDTAPFLGKVPVASIILFNEQLKGDVLEFAPCYHKACDTIEQVDPKSLEMAGEGLIYLINHIN